MNNSIQITLLIIVVWFLSGMSLQYTNKTLVESRVAIEKCREKAPDCKIVITAVPVKEGL